MKEPGRRIKDDPDSSVIDDIGKAFEDVSPEELEREVAKALAEVRAERRRERAARRF